MLKVAYIETVSGLGDVLERRSHELSSDIQILHLLDEKILQEIIANRRISKRSQRRLESLLRIAEKESSAILVTCSSIGEFCESSQVSVPLFRVDEPMAIQAVSLGNKIAVVATLEATLVPTTNLIKKHAERLGKVVKIKSYLCPRAFTALKVNDTEKHDHLVQESLTLAFSWANVVVLAQASMARLTKTSHNPQNIPVLNSMDTGLHQIKDFVDSRLSKSQAYL